MICCELDGKLIAYTNTTEFFVQIGKGPKGSYKNLYTIVGNLPRAVMTYNGINIGNGYKKRLFVPSFNRPVLARSKS